MDGAGRRRSGDLRSGWCFRLRPPCTASETQSPRIHEHVRHAGTACEHEGSNPCLLTSQARAHHGNSAFGNASETQTFGVTLAVALLLERVRLREALDREVRFKRQQLCNMRR